MQWTVLAVGRLKERYWREAAEEYQKRLSRYVRLEVTEVPDDPVPDNPSDAQVAAVLEREADRLERHLRERDGVVVLDRTGEMLSSEAWSRRQVELEQAGYGRLVFVIGGTCGLAPRIVHRAAVRWSFGPITLPHQLARIVLLEQLYRGLRIARGEPYHR
ncbi:MAG: 23S rRNA (pseudouridine(1915)-N(3))-methyltransferase RlmH [Thermoflavifilum sp.]|nr:23S rRNA (pseudouridine(1915)-N(3))-methyltransferase RlmH [Thermoflavifilum sp.]MCL6513121.1 23S rRNA (pseudouridine(1915)-N(3))-methyltransferase RlmH [Alicyclobacillus sp.]